MTVRSSDERLIHAREYAERQRDGLRAQVRELQDAIERMDHQLHTRDGWATEDADGWITSYQMPAGPWHRVLAKSRQITTGRNV